MPAGQTFTDSFQYIISDEQGNTAFAGVRIIIEGSNDAPQITLNEPTNKITIRTGEIGVPIFPNIQVSDVDSAQIYTAEIQLINAKGGDALKIINVPSDITYSITTGSDNSQILRLVGISTPHNYIAALRSITFENLSQFAQLGDRAFNVQVFDGNADSLTQTVTVGLIIGEGATQVPLDDSTSEMGVDSEGDILDENGSDLAEVSLVPMSDFGATNANDLNTSLEINSAQTGDSIFESSASIDAESRSLWSLDVYEGDRAETTLISDDGKKAGKLVLNGLVTKDKVLIINLDSSSSANRAFNIESVEYRLENGQSLPQGSTQVDPQSLMLDLPSVDSDANYEITITLSTGETISANFKVDPTTGNMSGFESSGNQLENESLEKTSLSFSEKHADIDTKNKTKAKDLAGALRE